MSHVSSLNSRSVRHRSVPPSPHHWISSEDVTPYHRKSPVVDHWKYDSLFNDRLWEYEHSPRSHRSSVARDIERYTPDRFKFAIATASNPYQILPHLTTKLRQTRIEAAKSAQLTCRLIGGTTSRIKWFKNGNEIQQGGKLLL